MNLDLNDLIARTGKSHSKLKLSVCIVTPDLLGPVRNGGIGTACTFLARELAASHAVSIFFSKVGTSAKTTDAWVADYSDRGIEVIIAEEWTGLREKLNVFPNHPPLAMAHTVYNWLTERVFDVVILVEWQGHGFYALHAKRGGAKFPTNGFHYPDS